MGERRRASVRRLDWSLFPISVVVLLICLFYSYARGFLVPYPGFTTNNAWGVVDLAPCEELPEWCQANQGRVRRGDQLLAIGDLSYKAYARDRRLVPFWGYDPGEMVPLVLVRDGETVEVLWEMPPFSPDWASALGGVVFYLPFWLAGTLVLLFLQPHDSRWRLLIASQYLTAMWLAAGMASQFHVALSSLVMHALSWLLVPVYLHLHIEVPEPLWVRRPRALWSALYAIGVLLAVLEMLERLPASAYILAVSFAVLGSLTLLIWRLVGRSGPTAQPVARMMLAGVGLALGPGLALVLVSTLSDAFRNIPFTTELALWAVPILPFSYTYALYKRHLGTLEFRANRLMALYAFFLIYATVYAATFGASARWLDLTSKSVLLTLLLSGAFALLGVPLYGKFGRWVSRLAYGTEHDINDIVRAFASRIPAALALEALGQLLTRQVAPALLIRQSALYLLTDDGVTPVYRDGVSLPEGPHVARQVHALLLESGRYRSEAQVPLLKEPFTPDFSWVRLAIALTIDGQPVGVWLFGRRDPDDYYPREDIELLTILADQVTVALQNIRLYERAQRELAERRQAEEARERLIAAIEQATEAIAILNAEGEIQYVNLAFEQITGHKRNRVLGCRLESLDSVGQRPLLDKQVVEVLARGESWSGRLSSVRGDGSRCELEVSISSFADPLGKTTEYIVIQRDVTEQATLEMELRQAQKMEAIGQLAGGVAHDFNNMLTALMGYTAFVKSGLPPDSPLREDVAEIERLGTRAAALTQQLLAFSRKQMLQPRVIDMNDLVANMHKMLRRLIREDIELTLVLAPEIGQVKADPGQIEQVIANLVVNARDAMPNGGVLTLRTANVELDESYVERYLDVLPGPYVMLEVSDTGIGMPPHVREHLFEPFFTTKEEGKGTGLGLATVYGIVKQSGGHIDLESEPDVGTSFRVYLPRLPAVETVEVQDIVEPIPRGSEHILLVEDEREVRALAQRTLERQGYTVLAAERPSEAIQIWKRADGPIHLLLTDVVLPEMSGCELADRLTATRPDAKVLYTTGYTDDAIVRHGVLEPGLNLLPKPYTPGELARKVRDVLDTS